LVEVSSPLSIAKRVLQVFSLVLVFLIIANVYLVSEGLHGTELKVIPQGTNVVIQAEAVNKGFLPLSLKVDLELCGKNFTWNGVMSPGETSVISLVVPVKYAMCKRKIYVNADMGGLLYVRVERNG